MIKEIKVILERKIPTGGLRFTVVEMVPNPAGAFPIESPIQNATVTITKDGFLVFQGWTDSSGIYQETGLPVGAYGWKVELPGYGTKQGTGTVET